MRDTIGRKFQKSNQGFGRRGLLLRRSVADFNKIFALVRLDSGGSPLEILPASSDEKSQSAIRSFAKRLMLFPPSGNQAPRREVS